MTVKITICCIGLILLGVVGCSSDLLQSSKSVLKSPMSLVNSHSQKPVAKILCLWEGAEGQGLDEKPSRGFAGQIMFFTYGSPSPIKVDGTVRIFEYSDFDLNDEDPQPIHQFTFKSNAWNLHCTEGTLGDTYNVFLPYVEKGQHSANCALRVEFEDQQGRKISSPFTEIMLTGSDRDHSQAARNRNFVTNHRSDTEIHDHRKKAGITAAATEASETAAEKLDTLTISLPR